MCSSHTSPVWPHHTNWRSRLEHVRNGRGRLEGSGDTDRRGRLGLTVAWIWKAVGWKCGKGHPPVNHQPNPAITASFWLKSSLCSTTSSPTSPQQKSQATEFGKCSWTLFQNPWKASSSMGPFLFWSDSFSCRSLLICWFSTNLQKMDELDKPLLDPENFRRDSIDLVTTLKIVSWIFILKMFLL